MKKIFLLIVLFSLFISGCSFSNSNISQGNVPSSTENGVIIDAVEVKEEKIDLQNYSLENMKEDSSSCFLWNRYGYSEDGCYYIDAGELKYIDFSTNKWIYVCNRPDCKHGREEADCLANFSNNYQYNLLQYTKEKLYILRNEIEDSIEKVMLYEISSDGNTRNPLMEIYRTEQDVVIGENGNMSTEGQPVHAVIHRDYIYYHVFREDVPKIRRMKLGENTSEVICSTTGERGTIYRLRAYGDYIFFQSGNFIDETMSDINAGIFAYNIHTGEVKLVKNNAIREYCIVGNTLFYYCSSENSLRAFSLDTQEDRLVIKTSNVTFADEKYVYSFGDGVLEVYSHQGEKVCVVQDKNIRDCYFGNQGNLIAHTKDRSVATINTYDFADGSAKWSIVEEYGVD